MLLRDSLSRLRLAGLIEGTSLLLLVLVAVPLKHLAGWPQAVSFIGPVHGLAFLIYALVVVETVSAGGWTAREIVRLVVACFVPFGPFFNEAWLRRKQAGLSKADIIDG